MSARFLGSKAPQAFQAPERTYARQLPANGWLWRPLFGPWRPLWPFGRLSLFTSRASWALRPVCGGPGAGRGPVT
ncbi:hypothetical protein ANACOL_03355 [Anaerotruncus colihominis DSM 17241]|uniref:Uncharacterized protein n=1 Tax=Anaerotruncus colihominis DSM 17241 TaxID=445972 RepID=B0PEX7_9FIRM|nr:hypothetical protein ANACOL_03355 [Anaerotruncus colihominis DSM 17241]